MNNTTTASRPSDSKKTSITFKLTQPPGTRYPFYPPTCLIPAEDEIMYYSTKEEIAKGWQESFVRTIKYIPGMKGIYVDQWGEKEREKRAKQIKFRIGFRNVSIKDRNQLDFLRATGRNKANESTNIGSAILFEEVDFEAAAKIAVEKDNKMISAKYFVNNANIDDVKAFAQALCNSKAEVEELYSKSDYEVRLALKHLAETKPELFEDGVNNPIFKNKVFIVKAIQNKIIEVNDAEGTISWASNGKEIVSAPRGMEVVPYFADIASKNDSYADLLDSITDLLNVKKESAEEAAKKSWQEEMIDEAVELGILTVNGKWYKILDNDGTDDPVALVSVNGKKNLIDALTKNESNILGLIAERRK